MTPISHVVGPCLHLCTIMNYNLKHHLLHVNTSIMEGSTHDAFENASMDITPDLETPARRVYENPNYINYILHPSKPAPHSAPGGDMSSMACGLVDDEKDTREYRRYRVRIYTCLAVTAAPCRSAKILNFWRLPVRQP
jgi:hypothetical protein